MGEQEQGCGMDLEGKLGQVTVFERIFWNKREKWKSVKKEPKNCPGWAILNKEPNVVKFELGAQK